MIPKTNVRGPFKWKVEFAGIRGGVIKARIEKNNISFCKKFMFRSEDSFDTAIRILEDKVFRILHLKNNEDPELGRLAEYAIESTVVEKMKDVQCDFNLTM